MREGWSEDDYLVLFSAAEAGPASAAYGLEIYLPGHTLAAIFDWDDFVVRSWSGQLFQIPAVPLTQK